MKARNDFNVQYPNLYATPGFHKQADEFNRVQRGHQSLFESLTFVMVMGLMGGIKHPMASAVSGALYCVGNVLYMLGYADTSYDVDKARHMKGGPIKSVGTFRSTNLLRRKFNSLFVCICWQPCWSMLDCASPWWEA